jgi:hypothetical protein
MFHPDATVHSLDLLTALVLPLQGFWNSLIYLLTSFSTCKEFWNSHLANRFQQREVPEEARNTPYLERRPTSVFDEYGSF